MLDITGVQPFQLIAGNFHVLTSERALDQPPRSAPDHVAQLAIGRRQPFAREQSVERGDQIRSGIDERPVEIEDDGGRGHVSGSL